MQRRKYPRIPVTILVDLFTPDSSVKKARACIVNISLGGMAIETEAKLELNSEILTRINLLSNEQHTILNVFAIVVREQNLGNLYHYGLKYTRMNFFEKFKLRNFIKKWILKQK